MKCGVIFLVVVPTAVIREVVKVLSNIQETACYLLLYIQLFVYCIYCQYYVINIGSGLWGVRSRWILLPRYIKVPIPNWCNDK